MKSAGFVLVGGRSSRMGRDKALLPARTGPLVSEIATEVLAVTGTVALIGRPAAYGEALGFDCLPDIRPGFGPLSGIHAALAYNSGAYNLIVACDMPDISRTLLALLLACAEAQKARCVVTVDALGQVHPLCAVYHSSARELVEKAIDSSRPRLMDLVSDLNAFPFEISSRIQNCNTPAEWAAVQQP